MTTHGTISAADLYAQIVDTVVAEPDLEHGLLADFDGTVARRFGVKLQKPGRLSRSDTGYRLTYDGKDYDLGDPRKAAKGELNDAELELVSGGGAKEDCDRYASDMKASYEKPFG